MLKWFLLVTAASTNISGPVLTVAAPDPELHLRPLYVYKISLDATSFSGPLGGYKMLHYLSKVKHSVMDSQHKTFYYGFTTLNVLL